MTKPGNWKTMYFSVFVTPLINMVLLNMLA